MSTKLATLDSDVNAWITTNNFFNAQNENIDVVANGNHPPTVKQYTRTQIYNTTSDTIPATDPTGNNEYGPGDTITYLISEAIFEDSADVTFTFGGTIRGETFPAISDGTWYLYLTGSLDTDDTTIGKGTYNASKDAPTFSMIKSGWYHATHEHAIARFTVTASVVSDIINLGFDTIKTTDSPITLSLTPGKVGQQCIDTTNGNFYFATGISAASDWMLASDSGVLNNTYSTGWTQNLLNAGASADWTNVDVGDSGTANSNVNHALAVNPSRLQVNVWYATDSSGTDAILLSANAATAASDRGYGVHRVDDNNIQVRTNGNGLGYVSTSGTFTTLTNQAGYYNVVVCKLY